jgi:hypothetical protein
LVGKFHETRRRTLRIFEMSVICWTENWIERVNRRPGRSDLFQ